MGACLECFKKKEFEQQQNEKDIKSNELQSQHSFEKKSTGLLDLMDTVNQKQGKITNNYSFLHPPLSKGYQIQNTHQLGAYSEIRKAVHKVSGIMKAVKIINKSLCPVIEQQKLLNEVEILKQLDHPNILKIYEFYQDEKYFYIVMELCTGGELFEKIQDEKFFTEKKAILIMKQILSAVSYCHSNNVVHRDLKPENLLIESEKSPNLKVINFGISRHFQDNEELNQKLGTPYYIAPEVLKKKYNEKCDIWSVGVMLYILLCGYPPFNGTTDKLILASVAKGQYNFSGEEWDKVSEDAKSLIRKMLEMDPAKRYSAQQCLADPWMKKYNSRKSVEIPIMKQVLDNLRSFRTQQKLQDAAYLYIVNYLTTQEEKNALLKTFQELDINGDGVLTKEELLIGYRKIMGEERAEEEVNRIMEQVDKNQSGSIDYTGKFVAASIGKSKVLSRERLEAAFKTFDQDGSGYLSIDELKEIFGQGKMPDTVWEQVVKDVDINGDGQISMEEFKGMMMKLSE